MTDNDTRLLSEAYFTKVLSEKALTPEQIAKKATPAGGKKSGGKSGGLPANTTEDKGIEKILAKAPYTDQDPENIDQDGKDTAVEDPYVLKEDTVPGSFEHVISTLNDQAAKATITQLYTNANPQLRKMIMDAINGASQKPNTNAIPTKASPGPEGVAAAM